MRTVAALIQRRPAMLALRRAVTPRSLRLLSARSPAHLLSQLERHCVDLVLLGSELAGEAFDSELRQRFPSLPTALYGPVRSDDARLLLRACKEGREVLVEGVDEPVIAAVLRRSGLTSRREAELLPMATRLHLTDPLQLRVWAVLVAEADQKLDTTRLAGRLGVRRETLSRRFSANGGPSLKAALDATRLAAASQLLASPGWRVADVARLLGFSSESLLQRT
ncbi:MAG TPA: helix-turn-helix domain-containing protein, partial [Gemmatimonadales bacterium]|nr:helix-turn-helix domain-containing protein [Gemmatimonadales bacterium]